MFPEIEGMEPQVTSQIKKKDTTGTHVWNIHQYFRWFYIYLFFEYWIAQ